MRTFAKWVVGAFLLIGAPAVMANTTDFSQTNLVSDLSTVAPTTDVHLKNPWGMAFGPNSPAWISDAATNVSTLYDGTGAIVPLVVSIPGHPTGVVFSNGDGFSGSPFFIFDTLSGNIKSWSGGTTTTTVASPAGAVYTGLTIAQVASTTYLYAANAAGGIEVFDTNFNDVTATTFAGKFVDPNPVAGFTPFNVQTIGSDIYVTYAAMGSPGGYVDEFDSSGNLIRRIATNGALDAPWGITLAPAGFGSFGGDLLIGNFGNGEINAYTTSGTFVGTMDGPNGLPLVNGSLWSLHFGNAGPGFSPDVLYFDAGINNQRDGLFGSISPSASAPEPSTFALLGGTFLAVLLSRKRRRADQRA